MTQRLQALRGATTLDEDSRAQVFERVGELVKDLIELNSLEESDIVSALFTGTSDIHSAFPATAGRAAGLERVPVMGAQELEVEGGAKLCVRIMMHVYTDKSTSEVKHVYLHGAANLRSQAPR